MNFGDRDAMLQMAQKRLDLVRKTNPQATLLDPDDVSVIYLTAYDPGLYHQFAVASNSAFDVTRTVALRKMLRPLTRITSRLL
jgi:formate dehydrogenase iron-sulfur subunit